MTIEKYDIVRSAKKFKVAVEGNQFPRYVQEGEEGRVEEVDGDRYLVEWDRYTRDEAKGWHTADDLIEIPKMQVSRDQWLKDYQDRQRALEALQFEQRFGLEQALKLWPDLTEWIEEGIDKSARKLLEFSLEASPYTDEQLAYWGETREGMRDVPLFSERGLYTLMGKEDARTVLALLSDLLKEAGYQGMTR